MYWLFLLDRTTAKLKTAADFVHLKEVDQTGSVRSVFRDGGQHWYLHMQGVSIAMTY
jgi:hypothetical protein